MGESFKGIARLLGYLGGHRLHFPVAMTMVVLMAYTSGVIPAPIRRQ